MGLGAAGVVSLDSPAQAEENSVVTAMSSTVISGLVEASYNGILSSDNKLANAFDSTSGIHNEDSTDFALLAGLSITAPDSLGFLAGTSAYVGYTKGTGDNESFYVGASMFSPIEGVSWGASYDDCEYAGEAGDDADAVALFAVWDTSDSISLALRYDTLDGKDGYSTSMWTATLGYSIWDNVFTRLELNNETGDRDHGSSSRLGLNLFYQF